MVRATRARLGVRVWGLLSCVCVFAWAVPSAAGGAPNLELPPISEARKSVISAGSLHDLQQMLARANSRLTRVEDSVADARKQLAKLDPLRATFRIPADSEFERLAESASVSIRQDISDVVRQVREIFDPAAAQPGTTDGEGGDQPGALDGRGPPRERLEAISDTLRDLSGSLLGLQFLTDPRSSQAFSNLEYEFEDVYFRFDEEYIPGSQLEFDRAARELSGLLRTSLRQETPAPSGVEALRLVAALERAPSVDGESLAEHFKELAELRYGALYRVIDAEKTKLSSDIQGMETEAATIGREISLIAAEIERRRDEDVRDPITRGPLMWSIFALIVVVPLLFLFQRFFDPALILQFNHSRTLVELVSIAFLLVAIVILGLAGHLRGEALATLLGTIAGYAFGKSVASDARKLAAEREITPDEYKSLLAQWKGRALGGTKHPGSAPPPAEEPPEPKDGGG